MMRRIVVAALAVAVAALGALAAVPAVRGQVTVFLLSWFSLAPAAEGEALVFGGDVGFTLHSPAYRPDGDWRFGLHANGGDEALTDVELKYAQAGRFFSLRQTPASEADALPAGEAVTVGGQPASLESGLSGTFAPFTRLVVESGYALIVDEGDGQDPLPDMDPIPYADGLRLTWSAGGARFVLLSNLPRDEVLRIAESLTPVTTRADAPAVEVPAGECLLTLGTDDLICEPPLAP
jgi:hypothetical protein